MAFSKEMLDFLVENKLRNDRPWYNERKEEFTKKVLMPLQELVGKLTPLMKEIDPLFEVSPKVDKTISRVYRDTRFTHDKSLFRDVMWIVFKRMKHLGDEGVPGFWFEIGPNGAVYGMGSYDPPKEFLEEMRKRILAKDPLFLKAKKMFESQQIFTLDGERFKRSKHPEQPAEIKFWIDRKNVSLMAKNKDFQLLLSDQLAAKLEADFRLIQPMYEFWKSVEENRSK